MIKPNDTVRVKPLALSRSEIHAGGHLERSRILYLIEGLNVAKLEKPIVGQRWWHISDLARVKKET